MSAPDSSKADKDEAEIGAGPDNAGNAGPEGTERGADGSRPDEVVL